MDVVMETKKLTKVYVQGNEKVFAVNQVDLKIHSGELIAIVGRSGSGKSTLLHLLGGIEVPTSGEILLCGTTIQKLNDRELTQLRTKHIGFIFQNYNLISELTVLENIRLPLVLSHRPSDRDYENSLIEMLGLRERLNFRPSQLSGGQQQRVSIARALITKPDIVLADEPTGNLDKKSGDRFIEFMEKTNRVFGQTYVMVTHNEELAHRMNRIITIDDGRVD